MAVPTTAVAAAVVRMGRRANMAAMVEDEGEVSGDSLKEEKLWRISAQDAVRCTQRVVVLGGCEGCSVDGWLGGL